MDGRCHEGAATVPSRHTRRHCRFTGLVCNPPAREVPAREAGGAVQEAGKDSSREDSPDRSKEWGRSNERVKNRILKRVSGQKGLENGSGIHVTYSVTFMHHFGALKL